MLELHLMLIFSSRSDEQRSEKHKLKKEKEIEKEVLEAEREDDGGFSVKVTLWSLSSTPDLQPYNFPQGRHGPYYPPPPPGPVIYCSRPARKPNPLVQWYKNFHFQAKKIDVVSRVAFPFAFALFNAYYWSYYLTRKQGHPES